MNPYLIAYLIGFVVCFILLAFLKAYNFGELNLKDVYEGLMLSLFWPLTILVVTLVLMEKYPSRIVLWRKKK